VVAVREVVAGVDVVRPEVGVAVGDVERRPRPLSPLPAVAVAVVVVVAAAAAVVPTAADVVAATVVAAAVVVAAAAAVAGADVSCSIHEHLLLHVYNPEPGLSPSLPHLVPPAHTTPLVTATDPPLSSSSLSYRTLHTKYLGLTVA